MPDAWVDPLIFAVACLGGGGVLLSFWLGFAPEKRSNASTVAEVCLGLLALCAAAFAVTAAVCGQPLAVWTSAGACALLYVVVVLLPTRGVAAGTSWLFRVARHRRSRFVLMLLLWAGCPFLALYLVYREVDAGPPMNDEELAAYIGNSEGALRVKPSLDSPLTTDRGRRVAILIGHHQASPTPELLASQARLLSGWGLNEEVISLPLGWQDCNCHGFVFTNGRFWISGDEVERILEDNGYVPVGLPRPPDVAVFRDTAGKIIHTGIVRGAAADGVILLESKWGNMGRFIHRHDRHPYCSSTCGFYRSPRMGHTVHGAETTGSSQTVLPIPLPDPASTSNTLTDAGGAQ